MDDKRSFDGNLFDPEDIDRILKEPETSIGWRTCLCGKKGSDAIRIYIVHPQIDEDSVCYATLPKATLQSFVDALRDSKFVK